MVRIQCHLLESSGVLSLQTSLSKISVPNERKFIVERNSSINHNRRKESRVMTPAYKTWQCLPRGRSYYINNSILN